MKTIKTTIIFVVLTVLLSACNPSDDSVKVFSGDDFVRFSLVLDANDNPIEFPVPPPPSFVEESNYEKSNLKTLKIPVTLTTVRDIGNVTVNFETKYLGNVTPSSFTVSPSDGILNFSNTKLTDTIVLNQNERVTAISAGQIQFNLTNTSDAKIKLGYDRDINSLKSLNIILSPTVTTTFTFEKSRQEILGEVGESFDFKILFPNGFIENDIDGTTLFGITSAFDVSITQQPITDNTEINYTAVINEALPEDSSFYSLLNLVDIVGYTQGAITCFQISKPIQVTRSGDPASNFYDLSDQFYRLRGDYWRVDSENPGSCEWFNHNVFSVPVVVEADDPNAVLFDDLNNNDPNDDIYHHRYKIGFVSPNAPIGTNPFALRNLLEGESNSSPGFNLVEAIEFFPENGNSPTNGSIAVIPQKAIVIRISDDAAFNIPISGSGTYELIDESTNLWRMDMEVTYDFTAVNGAIESIPIVLYNQSGQPDPELSNSTCFEPIEL